MKVSAVDLRRWKSNSICRQLNFGAYSVEMRKTCPQHLMCMYVRERQTEVGDCAKGRDRKDKMRGERKMQWRSQFSLGKSKGLFEDIKSH